MRRDEREAESERGRESTGPIYMLARGGGVSMACV